MLSFLRSLLCRDDEPNTGRIHYDESPSQSNNYQVIPNDYGTFSRNSSFPLSTQTATRTQSQDYSTSFNFPQKPNIPSVYNQPKHIFPKNDAKLISEVNPEKTSNQTKSQYNVVEKGSSSTPHNVIPEDIKGLIQEASQLDLNGSSTIVKACKYSGQQTGVSVVPHNSSSKADKSKKLLQSTSKVYLKGKGKIKLVGNQKLKIVNAEKLVGSKTSQKGNDYPETSRNPSRTLPTKDEKVDIDEYPKQSRVPAKRSLADYLCGSEPRLVSLYGSTELYPTDEARCIIQGMVRTILNLKKDGKKHNYLRHPENIILGDKECHPYSNYVRDLASKNVTRNRKILERAGHDFSTTTMVTLEKYMTVLKSDDLPALEYLIFDVILVLDDDKKPLLAAEWRSFKKLFSSSNTKLDYAVLSSHPCLWGYTKRLGFYFALDRWCNPSKSEKKVIDIVNDNLSPMRIFRTKWVKRIKRENHLLKFAGKMTPARQRKVYGLVRFFRNLVEHCSDEASASSPYKKERYLDYKLRNIFPNLLEELYQRLLLAGFNY